MPKLTNGHTLWLSSKEAQKALKVDSCELMHFRLEGKLRFRKNGNAYLYDYQDLQAENAKKANVKK